MWRALVLLKNTSQIQSKKNDPISYLGPDLLRNAKKDMLSFTLNIGKISNKLHVASINKSVFNTDLLFACPHLFHSMLLLCYLSI